MIESNKLIAKNSVILFLRLVVTSILGLLTSRFLLHGLGVSDFGLYNVVGGIIIFLAVFNTVMISSTYRFFAYELGKQNIKGVNDVFNISLIIHFSIALLVLILTESLGVYYIENILNIANNEIHDAIFILRFSSYSVILSIVSVPYESLITVQENFKIKAAIEVIRSILLFFIAWYIIDYSGNRVKFYVILVTFANLIPMVLFFIYCRFKYRELIEWNFQKDIRKYKEILGFTGWLMFGTSAWIGQRQGSQLIINIFFGTTLNASLGVANQINRLLQVFARNLSQATIPQIMKSVGSSDNNRTKSLLVYVSKYTYFVMLVVALPVLLQTEFLLVLWLGNIPPYTVVFCQLTIIIALLENFSNGISAAIQGSGKVKLFMSLNSIISLISLPLAYLLFLLNYPPYAILAIYIITTLTNVIVSHLLLENILKYRFIYFFKYLYKRVFYVTLSILPIIIINKIINLEIIYIIIFIILSIIWLLVAIYFWGMEEKERKLFREFLKKSNKNRENKT